MSIRWAPPGLLEFLAASLSVSRAAEVDNQSVVQRFAAYAG